VRDVSSCSNSTATPTGQPKSSKVRGLKISLSMTPSWAKYRAVTWDPNQSGTTTFSFWTKSIQGRTRLIEWSEPARSRERPSLLRKWRLNSRASYFNFYSDSAKHPEVFLRHPSKQ
jgi:hypothetical protein